MMSSVAARAVASSETIVQAKPNDVEAVVESDIEGGRGLAGKQYPYSCYPHCLGAQIRPQIFDLRTPVLVEEVFEATTSKTS